MLSIILVAIIVAGMHPPLNAASIACIILLMAGCSSWRVVLYHKRGALIHAKSGGQTRRGSGGAQTTSPAVKGPWTWSGVDRSAASIELRPSDSVEQIARTICRDVSFRVRTCC
jgi:hypothetical protein